RLQAVGARFNPHPAQIAEAAEVCPQRRAERPDDAAVGHYQHNPAGPLLTDVLDGFGDALKEVVAALTPRRALELAVAPRLQLSGPAGVDLLPGQSAPVAD